MRILLATDGSEYSETAARYVNRMGLGPDTEVFVLHVLKDYLLPDDIDPARDFRKAGRRGAEALVFEFKAMLTPAGYKVHALVREGEPWQEILEGAQDVGADLIVMGHKGLSGINRFLIGGIAHKVARYGAFSTLIVRELPILERPMRILYCTDGSYSARHARDLLRGLPFREDTEVYILSVVDMDISSLPEKYYPDEEVSLMMAELREHNRKQAEKAVAEDAALLKVSFRDVREHVVFGVPDAEIVMAAEGLQADLVVMGSKGTRGIKGILLGSASHRVLKHADCSVLIAKLRQPQPPNTR